ncbi:MAG: LytR C-terminal domain-containing protein [Candidatus Daviesbacteria bacterium]|nr:LytR C-terminal domain-containing protein [Candidatus Daviesbacteria bacterium]
MSHKKTAHKSGWKAAQSNRKTRQRTNLAIIVLVLITLLFLGAKVVSFINNLNQPITKTEFLPVRHYVWDQTSRLNIVVKTNQISLLSYDPLEKTVTIINLPDTLYLPVTGGHGNWQLSSIFGLGQAEEKKLGAKLLKNSLSNYFGLPIDGFIEYQGSQNTYDLVQTLKDGVLTYVKLTPHIKTDLTSSEMLKFVWGLSKVRFDKIEQVDLSESGVLDRSQLADGTQVYTSDPDRIDSITVTLLEGKIVSEKAAVSVINGTETIGLAQKGSRIISNLGGNVIFSANATKIQDKSAIYVSKVAKAEFTAKRLTQVFASDCSNNLKCDIIICEMSLKYTKGDKCFNEDLQILDSRADINIILGEDSSLRN